MKRRRLGTLVSYAKALNKLIPVLSQIANFVDSLRPPRRTLSTPSSILTSSYCSRLDLEIDVLGLIFGYVGKRDPNTLNLNYNLSDFVNKIASGAVIWAGATSSDARDFARAKSLPIQLKRRTFQGGPFCFLISHCHFSISRIGCKTFGAALLENQSDSCSSRLQRCQQCHRFRSIFTTHRELRPQA